jgi:sugar O-acyltransferase (sialic acid O-acetyltransferase NeuD family)
MVYAAGRNDGENGEGIMTKIVIFGAGETGHLAYEYFTHDPDYKDYEVVAFCLDPEYIKDEQICGLPVVSSEEVTSKYPPAEYAAFAAASSGHLNRDREKLYNSAKDKGYKLVSYISARAFVWHNVEIGENCFILEDNTLQPFTKVGNNVVMWSGNHLGHRSVIEDHCFITSHVVISGYCNIGHHSFIGVNATLANDLTIAPDNFIALGTTLTKNTEEDGFYIGTPAEKKKISAKRYSKVA